MTQPGTSPQAQAVQPVQREAQAALPDAQATQTPPLVFEHVQMSFDGNVVLQDISFTIGPGETRVLLGPAGSGKSVLMKLANGLLMPDSGSIRVFGQEITKLTEDELFELRRRVGMVFQESALFDSIDVEENVAFRLLDEGVTHDDAHQRVVESLDFVEMGHAINKFPAELSGGMKRRVSIARAIITHPDLILYDSPTGGLDPVTSTTIVELLVKQRDVAQTTALMITHRLQDAFTMATHRYNQQANRMEPLPEGQVDPQTRFLVLNGGRIVFDGSTLELTHSTDPFIREYLEP